MKIVALILNRFGKWLIWLDQQGVLETFGKMFFKIGKTVYPRGYCKNCGSWLELCYSSNLPEKVYCCECCRTP